MSKKDINKGTAIQKSLLFIFLFFPLNIMAQSVNDSLLKVLDVELNNRYSYYEQKEKEIASLKRFLISTNDLQKKSEAISNLFDEYISYQYDSAYCYAGQAVELAKQSGDTFSLTKARINLLHCYVASGLFKEAHELLSTINIAKVSPNLRIGYYILAMRFYTNLMFYNDSEPFYTEYTNKGLAYSDSIKMYLTAGTQEYAFYDLMNCNLVETNSEDKIKKYEQILKNYIFSNPQYAIIYTYLGQEYEKVGNTEQAIYYTALSSLYDIRASIRQTTSKTFLGQYLYKKGKVMFASKCIRMALEDANFYNARHRKLQVNSFLPVIEAEKVEIIEDQKEMLTMFLVVLCVLVIVILCFTVLFYKQIRKLNKARRVIQDQYNEIFRINTKLEKTNDELEHSKAELEKSYQMLSISAHQLEEINEIKDIYITQTLYGKSEYLDRFENLVKKVERKIQAKQYQDLNRLYQEFNLKSERENMFSSFDKTFLILFPHFIEEYNKLFAPEDQITPDENGNLSPELRIFALMRLGVTENERIAKFLNLSVKTVYSYRYKARIRAIIPKEDFEHIVMQIKKRTNN